MSESRCWGKFCGLRRVAMGPRRSAGWLLRDGKLISAEGWEVTTGDVLSLPLLRAQIAGYQAKERQIMAMDAQPEPGELPAIRA